MWTGTGQEAGEGGDGRRRRFAGGGEGRGERGRGWEGGVGAVVMAGQVEEGSSARALRQKVGREEEGTDWRGLIPLFAVRLETGRRARCGPGCRRHLSEADLEVPIGFC